MRLTSWTAIFSALLLADRVSAAIISVTPGSDQLQTALNALTSANNGDELVLDDGTYTSSVTSSPTTVGQIDNVDEQQLVENALEH